MKYFEKYSRLFTYILGIFILIFVGVVGPAFVYFQLIVFPQSQQRIKQNCIEELKHSSQQLRDILEIETEQAKRWTPNSPLLKHWLYVKKYDWQNNHWKSNIDAQNSPLIKLYKVNIDQLNSKLDKLATPHPLSKNLQLYEIKTDESHLISISTVNDNQLYTVVLPANVVIPSIERSNYCTKNILKSDGNFLFSSSKAQNLESLLVELQSQPLVESESIREIRLSNGTSFIIKNLFNNIFIASELDYSAHSTIKSFWNFFKLQYLIVFLFLIWGAVLLTHSIFLKQNSVLQTIDEMSHGIFRPLSKAGADPIYSTIQTGLTAFANQHLNKMRTITKQIKLNNLRDKKFMDNINDQNFKMINTIILQIDLINLESVLYDYKFHHDLGELNSLWANICECLKESEAIIDNLTGGSIRAFWISEKPLSTLAESAGKIIFEIQDLVIAINKNRFLHNSSPYKLNYALHSGDLILALLGPLERKEFTGLGPSLTAINKMLHIAKIQQSVTIVSEAVFELLNQSYLFTVLNVEGEKDKFYSIHKQLD